VSFAAAFWLPSRDEVTTAEPRPRDVSDDDLLAALNSGLAEAPETELLAAADTLTAIHGPTPADLAATLAQPIEYTVRRFRCPHCTRSRSTRKLIAEHMARCWKNPAVRACVTCRHHELVDPEPEVGLPGAELCHAVHGRIDYVHTKCPLWALRSVAS
jgi:hypothetical protein